MIKAEHRRALFVINRCSSWDTLSYYCVAQRYNSVVILSSNTFFPFEQAQLAEKIAPSTAVFISFADLFCDDDLAKIDAKVTHELTQAFLGHEQYVRRYHEAVMRTKNTIAYERIRGQGPFERIYVGDGLGIHPESWRQAGALQLDPKPILSAYLKAITEPTMDFVVRISHKAKPKEHEVFVLHDSAASYYFIGNLKRLRLSGSVSPKPFKTRFPLTVNHGNCFGAVTLHEYTPIVHRMGLPVRIFVDSYLPSNYPRSYLDGYGKVEFVSPDPFSARWLHMHGFSVIRPPAFVQTKEFFEPAPPARIKNIVLLMNHAGDWSALINRSDSDRLAMAFAKLAIEFPNLNFIIRPHPGADSQEHEGSGVIVRLAAFVADQKLSNLSVSTESLAYDFDRGDMFLSEYSATLIEAWQRGKLGVAVNVTKRRSFMQDFAELGFSHANGYLELLLIFRDACRAPDSFARQQAVAVSSYNIQLRKLRLE